MLGGQIVATDFSDDFTQLQLILSHAVGGMSKNIILGAFLEAKNAPLEVSGNAQMV